MKNTISLYEKGTGYNRLGEYYVVQYPRTSDGDLYGVGDYGDDGDFAIWDTMIVCSNIYLREDGE